MSIRIKRERGFSLLEMIAALTILAIGSVVLFSWLGQTMGQLTRFKNDEKSSLAKLQAVQYLATQNPSLTPNGVQKFDTFKMEWKSAPVSELRDSISPSNGLGMYQMRLYGVQVAIFDTQGRAWFNFPVRLVGYEQVRQPTPNKPF
jgi:prepilin-type N-terminal cleavage/methylation domain-containing protein